MLFTAEESERISSSAELGVALQDNLISNSYAFSVVKEKKLKRKKNIKGVNMNQEKRGKSRVSFFSLKTSRIRYG